MVEQEKETKESPHQKVAKQWGLEWLEFLRVVIEPFSACLAVLSAIIIYAASQQKDVTVMIASTVFVGVLTGIIGARIDKRLSQGQEQTVVRAVGNNAIRMLKHLYQSISSLEKKARKDSEALKAVVPAPSPVTPRLEELAERCMMLKSETLNSIENWSDVMTGTNVKAEIESLTEQKFEIEFRQNEVDRRRVELSAAQVEKKELAAKLEAKESELVVLRKDYAVRDSMLATSLSGVSTGASVSGALAFDGSATGYVGVLKTPYSVTGLRMPSTSLPFGEILGQRNVFCSQCGKLFSTSTEPSISAIAGSTILCNDCAKVGKPS
jgi:hypothetical protein